MEEMSDWIEEAREIAAQCWCDPETRHIVMDPLLAEAVAKRIAAWMDAAAENGRNVVYCRGLVVKCGESIGKEAYIQDDGGVAEEVLCAKVPELVERVCKMQAEDEDMQRKDITVDEVEDWIEESQPILLAYDGKARLELHLSCRGTMHGQVMSTFVISKDKIRREFTQVANAVAAYNHLER